MESIKLSWLGHSCFNIENDGYSIICDPYTKGSVPGLKKLNVSANQVICSHMHSDHGGHNEVKLVKSAQHCPFVIHELHSYHDEKKGGLRGENTMYIFSAGGVKVAHLGDIGCMPTEEQLKHLCHLDAVMVPVGEVYTMEQEMIWKLLDTIAPKVIIPMHYRGDENDFPELTTVEEFIKGKDNVVHYATNTIEITKDMKPQIAILEF